MELVAFALVLVVAVLDFVVVVGLVFVVVAFVVVVGFLETTFTLTLLMGVAVVATLDVLVVVVDTSFAASDVVLDDGVVAWVTSF